MMHEDFVIIFKNFVNFFGEVEGSKRFKNFLKDYKLDPSKPYLVQVQLMRECINGICESFQWAKPLIQYLRMDDEAKYYKVRALTANISMNKNDYTNLEELERAARTLTGALLNINHDHNRRLPHPDSQVEWAEFEDNAVEAIIKIHNSQKWVQDALENGDILNPSIEGTPRGGNRTPDGRFVPVWYELTELALLEKDYTLPGDPVTYGFEPLILSESMTRSLVKPSRIKKEPEKTEQTRENDELKEDMMIQPEEAIKGIWFKKEKSRFMES